MITTAPLSCPCLSNPWWHDSEMKALLYHMFWWYLRGVFWQYLPGQPPHSQSNYIWDRLHYRLVGGIQQQQSESRASESPETRLWAKHRGWNITIVICTRFLSFPISYHVYPCIHYHGLSFPTNVTVRFLFIWSHKDTKAYVFKEL